MENIKQEEIRKKRHEEYQKMHAVQEEKEAKAAEERNKVMQAMQDRINKAISKP